MKGAAAPLRRALERAIHDRLGLTFSRARESTLETGLVRAAERLGVPDAAMLLARLQSGDPGVLEALADELTIPETYFFRDGRHLKVVTRIASLRAAEGRPVRLWSAGCATGEEAYSMAIAALEAAPDAAIDVLGTDIAPRALEAAHRALYRPWSFRGVDPLVRQRWFTDEGDKMRPIAAVRDRVRFAPMNLIDGDAPGTLVADADVVFCRNVLLYFDAEGIAAAGQTLARAVAKDGFIVLGPSDPLLDVPGLYVDTTMGFITYRRGEAPARASTTPRAPPVTRTSAPPSRRESPTAPPPPPLPPQGAAPSVRDPTTDLARARALADAGELDAALALLANAIAPDALLLRAIVKQAANDHEGAISDATQAADEGSPLAAVTLAVSHARRGDVASARAAIAQARTSMDRTEGAATDGVATADLERTLRAVEQKIAREARTRRTRR
jgi:chemotaxis protein methyltransferase CheR